jgi:hypothetical protein
MINKLMDTGQYKEWVNKEVTMKTISIECDQCGEELVVDSQFPAKYSLELNCINTGINTSDACFSVHIEPPFNGQKHFCNVTCLFRWAKTNGAQTTIGE